ncbi:hypothetical protein JTB14_015088 [Gonioctena quinquepunctata]|nr:hypothetical protein JTB14_015088 [Gonioctena quinquepunctata]
MSTGPDEIPSASIRESGKELASILTHLLNHCSTTGILSDYLKSAKITPVFKKEERTCIEDHRPVSGLSPIAKARQKLSLNNILGKIKNNNFVITKADKKNSLVILNNFDYIDKVLDFLNSNNFSDPTLKFIRSTKIDLDITVDTIIHYQIRKNLLMPMKPPYLALRVLKKLAEDENKAFSQAAKVLSSETVVNDIITGSSTLEKAHQLQIEHISSLKKDGFEAHKWTSNIPEALSNIA